MSYRSTVLAAAAALAAAVSGAGADEAKYPNWKGEWTTVFARMPGQQLRFDPSKPYGKGQEAPLTEEYQQVHRNSMEDQRNGGLGNYPTARCLPGGMPRMMVAFEPQEYIITPRTTYILIGENDHYRRIFTDGRDWPKDI